jgi:hypothetical protein
MNDTVQAQMENRESYVTSRFNALQHGVLSRYVVLPWEDEKEYQALLGALVAEHKPQGPTEEHLVEELAGILWRKRRLRLAEGAACRRGLVNVASDRRTVDAALVHLDIAVNDTSRELADVDQAEATTTCAVDLLQTGKARAYEKALAMLPDDTQERWTELSKPILGLLDLSDQANRYTADAEGLLEFLQDEVMPRYEARRTELQNRPLVQEQVLGEALDTDKLDRLARYEVHLDRKLERMLTMLIRLQDLRASSQR